jgi:hypothetical protein
MVHVHPNPAKPIHSVFALPPGKLIQTIDEAWAARGRGLPSPPYEKFEVDLLRVIGVGGETKMRIVVKPGTSEIISAFPIP